MDDGGGGLTVEEEVVILDDGCDNLSWWPELSGKA